MNSFHKSQLTQPCQRTTQGFLLIELCITIACLGFIAAGIGLSYTQALAQETAAYKKLKALQITQSYNNELQIHKNYTNHDIVRENYTLRVTITPTKTKKFYYLTIKVYENNLKNKDPEKPIISLVTGLLI